MLFIHPPQKLLLYDNNILGETGGNVKKNTNNPRALSK